MSRLLAELILWFALGQAAAWLLNLRNTPALVLALLIFIAALFRAAFWFQRNFNAQD